MPPGTKYRQQSRAELDKPGKQQSALCGRLFVPQSEREKPGGKPQNQLHQRRRSNAQNGARKAADKRLGFRDWDEYVQSLAAVSPHEVPAQFAGPLLQV